MIMNFKQSGIPTLLAFMLAIPLAAHSYGIISKHYKLSTTKIAILFDPSLVENKAYATFKNCRSCPEQAFLINDTTIFYIGDYKSDFKKVKEQIMADQANPPKEKQLVMIGLDPRPDVKHIFELKWRYIER